jgi:hypothetical protein
MPIDQWPWEDCHGVDCKHAVDERRWERTMGQKLKQDAADMSDLAYADAQMGGTVFQHSYNDASCNVQHYQGVQCRKISTTAGR